MINLDNIETNSKKEISLEQFNKETEGEPLKEKLREMLEKRGYKFVKGPIKDDFESGYTSCNLPENFKEKVVFNVPNSTFLTPNIEYSALDPLDEALAICAIKLGGQIAKHLEALDEKAIEELKNAGYYDILKDKVNKGKKAEDKVLLSYVPYIVKKIVDFFNVKLYNIEDIDSYINDCLQMIKNKLYEYDVRIGGKFKRFIIWDVFSQIRKTYGEIGGKFKLSESQIKERTEIYKIRQENPNITNEEIANKFGHDSNTTTFNNFLKRIEKYDDWLLSAEVNARENDYYSSNDYLEENANDIDRLIKLIEDAERTTSLYKFLYDNFKKEHCEIYLMYYNFDNKFEDNVTYEDVAEMFNTTKQNVYGIVKKINAKLKDAVSNGIIKI